MGGGHDVDFITTRPTHTYCDVFVMPSGFDADVRVACRDIASGCQRPRGTGSQRGPLNLSDVIMLHFGKSCQLSGV